MINFENFLKIKTRKQVAVVAAVLLAASSVPLLFENCAPSPTANNTTAGSVAQTAPFAFEASVDTIAYMSCDNETPGNYTPGQLWTFKAAALGINSGLRISLDFLNSANGLTSTDMITAVEQSKLSAGAYAQLAIRVPAEGMQQYLQGNSPGLGESNFGIAPIDNGSSLQALFNVISPGTWVNAFNTSGSGATPFAGYLDFTTAVTTGGTDNAQYVRNLVSAAGGGFLALDFTNATLDTSPYEGALPVNSSTLYGLGYQMSFGPGKSLSQAETITGANRVLTGISEFSLSTLQEDGIGWNCLGTPPLMIVRPGPDAATFCPVNNTVAPPTIVSEMLPSWQINWAQHCAVPKAEGICYGENPAGAIDYNGSTSCTATSNCPHYISICTRNPI